MYAILLVCKHDIIFAVKNYPTMPLMKIDLTDPIFCLYANDIKFLVLP